MNYFLPQPLKADRRTISTRPAGWPTYRDRSSSPTAASTSCTAATQPARTSRAPWQSHGRRAQHGHLGQTPGQGVDRPVRLRWPTGSPSSPRSNASRSLPGSMKTRQSSAFSNAAPTYSSRGRLASRKSSATRSRQLGRPHRIDPLLSTRKSTTALLEKIRTLPEPPRRSSGAQCSPDRAKRRRFIDRVNQPAALDFGRIGRNLTASVVGDRPKKHQRIRERPG